MTRLARAVLISALITPSIAHAQAARDSSMINRSTNPLLANFRFRGIGPASMGGRIDDIEVAPSDPNIIYLGYATSGVFKSENNGTSFTSVFDTYGSASIGDIAIHPTNADIVYVGTGEPNNRNTSSFGDGIYKTTDGGKTFTHVGLRETQTIARIVIDPKNPETVYVAALGHLFGPNPDRGIYKSTDGGKSWTKIKYIDENTGFTDLVMDPSNTNVLYAASYQRRRTGCCVNGGGPGSGLWKTDNGGRTWTQLTGNGLPPGTFGRIAVDVARSNPNVVYAQIETDGGPGAVAGGGGGRGGAGGYDWCNNAGPGRGFGGGRGGGAPAATDSVRTPPALENARSGIFRSNDKGRNWTAVSNCNGRPLYFSQVRVDPSNENTLFIAGVRMAKSLDGGKSFLGLDAGGGFFNMGEDQHAIWIDPKNSRHVLRGNDAGFAITWDQGKSWEYVRTMPTALAYWVSADMGHPYYVYTGLQDNDSWAGPSLVRGRTGIGGHNWFHLSGGDGFQTAVDPTDFRIIYSESQDGNTVRTDLRTGRSQSIRPVARAASGAAAASTAACVDGRITMPGTGGGGGRGGGGGGGGRGGGAAQSNVVNSQPGDTYRFNWNTPLLLSPHNPGTVWIGSNRLFKSYDKGEHWIASADLTRQVDRCTVTVMGVAGTEPQLSKNDGVGSFSTISTISESPLIPGVMWVGTDDGLLHVSRAGDMNFVEVGKNLPGLPSGALTLPSPYWISRVEASHFDAGTAYVAVDGHRTDDLRPYIFVTRDYGQTFQSVSANLPASGNVLVVREDPVNKNLLYAGTEFGLFVTLDGGKSWNRFMNNYPTVRTDDILVHPRDGDLIVATHGRSIWIADDITPLQQWTDAVAAADVTLFDVRPAIAYVFDYRTDADVGGDKRFEGENPARGTAIHFFLKSAQEVKLSITDLNGRTLCTATGPAMAGLNRMQWTLVAPMLAPAGGGGGGRGGGQADTGCSGGPNAPVVAGGGGRGGGANDLAPGTYIARLTVGGREYTKPIQVLEDRWLFER